MPVKRHAEGTHASNRLRCLRVLLNRLLALRAHFLDGTLRTVEAVNLQRKIRRCPHLPAVQGHSARIQAVKDLIGATEKQQHDDHIKAWKNRLRASDIMRALGGCTVRLLLSVTWCALVRPFAVTALTVRYFICVTSGDVFGDASCLTLKRSWMPVEGCLVSRSLLLNGPRSVLKSLLTPLRTNAVRARALMDGPGAKLLRYLWPSEPSWLRFSVPAKDGESPISVITTFWRVYTSARLKSACAAEWVRSWMPDDAFGGRKGADVHRAASKILEPVNDGWCLGSFDYSLAFDHVRPELVCRLMKHLGMPEGLADMIMIFGVDRSVSCNFTGVLEPDSEGFVVTDLLGQAEGTAS
eukprot:s3308_g1.t1